MRRFILPLTAVLALCASAGAWSATPTADKVEQARAAWQRLAESMLADIHKATWISEGSGPGVIYIFFDPNCPYCHKLYLNTRSWIKEGKAQLRWIPVGILTTTSHGKATALLTADDPLKAFYDNEDHYEHGGGIDEDIPSPKTDAELDANAALLARTRTGAVPTMLFRAKDGTPILIQGAPRKDKLPIILENLATP